MDDETKKIVDAWIKMSKALSEHREQPKSEEVDPHFWASELLFELVDGDPERAWPILLAIRNATDDQQVLAHLAAGHFEDLINMHGYKFIDRIEALAKEDKDFRHFIGGIWPDREMPQDLLDRFKAIALKPHWD
ncbi:MAG: DUF6869 domain-containing protein [Alphaproteobacteria bacterium]